MKMLQKTVCHRDRKFRKVTFENQGISGNSKKRGALLDMPMSDHFSSNRYSSDLYDLIDWIIVAKSP